MLQRGCIDKNLIEHIILTVCQGKELRIFVFIIGIVPLFELRVSSDEYQLLSSVHAHPRMGLSPRPSQERPVAFKPARGSMKEDKPNSHFA
nr:hypothetical protein Itr_chr15CG00850 [Ipomoea trifida]